MFATVTNPPFSTKVQPDWQRGGCPGGVRLEAGARRRLQAAPEGDAPLRLFGLGHPAPVHGLNHPRFCLSRYDFIFEATCFPFFISAWTYRIPLWDLVVLRRFLAIRMLDFDSLGCFHIQASCLLLTAAPWWPAPLSCLCVWVPQLATWPPGSFTSSCGLFFFLL